jgi:hypothetical protein
VPHSVPLGATWSHGVIRNNRSDSPSSDQRGILTLRNCFLSGGHYDALSEGTGEDGEEDGDGDVDGDDDDDDEGEEVERDIESEHEEGGRRAEEEESQEEAKATYSHLRRFIPDVERLGYLNAKRLFESAKGNCQ